jgi:hypothetical protein
MTRHDDLPCGCNESQDYLDLLKKIYISIIHIDVIDRSFLERQIITRIETVANKYKRSLENK